MLKRSTRARTRAPASTGLAQSHRWWLVAVAVCALVLLFHIATVPWSTTPSKASRNAGASQHSIFSSSPHHIHFRVQEGLRVVAQHELDALHVRQRDELHLAGGAQTDSDYVEMRTQSERWEKCAEKNESQWTCSACTYPLLDYHHSWGQHGSTRVADELYMNRFAGTVPLHGFVHAVHESYRRHLPLTIAVEDIWILIVQGLSQHINHRDNAERLRHQFVRHEGKQVMEVSGMRWQDIFASFADELSLRTVPGRASLFAQPFSATSAVQSLIMQATVMEAMQAYYEYLSSLTCGIPSVRLLGSVDDWLDLQRRLTDLRLSQLDASLAPWETKLHWIVEQMVASRQGVVDTLFWQSFYRMRIAPFAMSMGCAGPPDRLDGHLTSFFPYVSPSQFQHKYTELEANPALVHTSSHHANDEQTMELSLSQIPTGVSRVPFIWMKSPWGEKAMRLYAGFDDANVTYGDGMEGAGEVRATYGWALTV